MIQFFICQYEKNVCCEKINFEINPLFYGHNEKTNKRCNSYVSGYGYGYIFKKVIACIEIKGDQNKKSIEY